MRDIIKLLRVKHWIKNLLCFLPLVFYKSINISDYCHVLLGCLAFSLMASSIYIINGVKDVEKDKRHEIKKERPIAAGRVSVFKAILFMILCLAISIGIDIAVSESIVSFIILCVYLVLNVLYSFGLKDRPIFDIVILASGFVLRVIYGGELVSIPVSPILILTVMAFALYMGLGKRRNEKKKIKEDTREVLKYYTKDFLDKNMYFCLSIGVVFYSIWALSLGDYYIYTVIGVIIICMRYSLIVESDSLGDPVDVLLSDKVLIGMVILFSIVMLLLLFC